MLDKPTSKPRAGLEPKISEQMTHEAIVQLLKFSLVPGVIAYHSAGGELRGKRTAVKLKRMGVIPGVADLSFVLPGGKAAFLEIKSPIGRQSKEQKEFEAKCLALGSPYAVVRSMDEARTVLKSWGAVR